MASRHVIPITNRPPVQNQQLQCYSEADACCRRLLCSSLFASQFQKDRLSTVPSTSTRTRYVIPGRCIHVVTLHHTSTVLSDAKHGTSTGRTSDEHNRTLFINTNANDGFYQNTYPTGTCMYVPFRSGPAQICVRHCCFGPLATDDGIK